jgi:hypothetical protein
MRKSKLQINEWIRSQQARLGIPTNCGDSSNLRNVPTMTVYPSPYVIERLAHAGADLLIANNPAYAAACERLDGELAEILEAGIPALRRRKSALAQIEQVRPRVLTND